MKIKSSIFSVLILSFSSAGLFAESNSTQSLPKLELGFGAGGQYLADYRGSSEYSLKAIPFPILIYRGDFIKADRRGIRGEFFKTDRLELNISAEASLTGGTDNERREGMEELDSTFELGPSLNVNLSGEDFDSGFSLRIPVRAVYAADVGHIEYIGYVFNPKLTYRKPNLYKGWDSAANIGGLWGSEKYHDYYYSVDQQYVTADRPFYQADSGFSGYYFKASLSKRTPDYFVGFNLRYDNLSGTSFEDSPLVETKNYFSIGFGFGWFLWKSN